MNRSRWGSLVERFINDLSNNEFQGQKLDVRENVKFRGGNFSRWIHETFPDTVCALAIEVKKTFMDEWTGIRNDVDFAAIHEAFASTIPGLRDELKNLKS